MAHETCTNSECMQHETQLRLAKLREELLTNFNNLLIDRIRFLEETITRLATPLPPPPPPPTPPPPLLSKERYLSPESIKTNRLSPPSPLRRSSSENISLQLSPSSPNLSTAVHEPLRSCPSSVDLSKNNDQSKWFLAVRKSLRLKGRTSSDGGNNTNILCIPMQRQWASSTNDLVSSTNPIVDKGRLETRRFACDVDDNDVRAFKALLYMEQARKQNLRPLTRLRQVLGISSSHHNSTSNSSSPNFGPLSPTSSKKSTNV